MPQYKFLEGFAMLAGTGHIVTGPVEFGPFTTPTAPTRSRNATAAANQNDFSRKVWLRSFVPTDVGSKWKYGEFARWRKTPRTEVFVEHIRTWTSSA